MTGDPQGSLRRTIVQIRSARLTADDWAEIHRRLADVERQPGDSTVEALGSAVFEAKVRRRFAGGRAQASIPPTKQTSVLPVVGAICALSLFGVGALLGGGVILVGIGLLSAGVFAVAFAGSRVAHRPPTDPDEPEVVVVAAPASVLAACDRLDAPDPS